MAVGTVDIRAFWPWDTGDPPGTHPIPAGWTRDTDFDNRFLQGSDNTFVGAADGGGAHNHSDDTDGVGAGHTHVGNSHTHTFNAYAVNNNPDTADPPGSPPPPNVVIAANKNHSHASETSNPATITYSNDAATIDNADMKPPWVQAIIIKPDDINQDIPDDAVCFGDEATPPAGFAITDGTGGTSDLDDRFVIGAAPAGVGGGTGGSLTHTHTSPVHDHDPDDHSHPATLCGYASATVSCKVNAPALQTRVSRHHNVTLVTKALADVSDTAVTVQAASSEPAYIKLLGIQNTSGGATTPEGVIVPFVGAYGTLPAEWTLCDGSGGTQDCTDRQVKITTTAGEIGDTGGSNTHTHAVTTHGHTHTSFMGHNHYTSAVLTGTGWADVGATEVLDDPHLLAHFWRVGRTIPTMQNATITLSTDDGRFNYRTMIWVKYAPLPPPPPAPPAPPIPSYDEPELFVPGWNDTTRPETFQPGIEGNHSAPVTRGWSADKCGVTTFGTRVMEGGWGRPCTLHPVRATPHKAEHANKERCRHHYGHFAVNDRGWTVPVYCCNPNSEASDDKREGRGLFYVAGENDPHCEPGNSCGVASMPLPDTFLGFFHSNSWACGDLA